MRGHDQRQQRAPGLFRSMGGQPVVAGPCRHGQRPVSACGRRQHRARPAGRCHAACHAPDRSRAGGRMPRRPIQHAVALLGAGIGQRLRHLPLPRLPAHQRLGRQGQQREPPAHVRRARPQRRQRRGLPHHRNARAAVRAHQGRARAAHPGPPHAERLGVVRLHAAVVLATLQPRHLAPLPRDRPRTGSDVRVPHRRQAALRLALALQRHRTGAPVQRPEPAAVAQLEPRLPDDRAGAGQPLDGDRPRLEASA